MSIPSQLLSLADRCVKCGMCLPHCPTYQAWSDENDSPRGRIALLQGLAGGRLPASNTLRRHLDRCIGCRRCERICPAGVEFERLLDTARQLPALRTGNGRQRLALRTLGSPVKMRRFHALLRWLQRSGLLRLAQACGLLRLLGLDQAARLLPPLGAAGPARTSPPAKIRDRVVLFTGCLGTTLERETAQAAVRVLEAFGYAVTLLDTGCCGALAWHRGETAIALAQAKPHLEALTDDDPAAILYLATGCGTHLQRYDTLPFDDARLAATAERFVARLEEITHFLARQPFPEHHRPPRQEWHVAVHLPCSQINGLRQPDCTSRLLGQIPGIRLTALPDNDRCCGAGGSHLLSRSTLAERLRSDKLEAIAATAPDVVVSTNPGCSLFLNAGLGHEPALRVVHPVVVLDAWLNEQESV